MMDLNISRPNGLLVGQRLLLYSSAAGALLEHGYMAKVAGTWTRPACVLLLARAGCK